MAIGILKNLYVRFVDTHGMARHFRSLTIWDAFRRDATPRDMPRLVSERLLRASSADADAVLASLDTQRSGLSDERAEAIRREVGTNEVGTREADAVVAAPVGVLRQSVQPAADRARARVVLHRGQDGDDRDRDDGRAVDGAALRAGDAIEPCRRRAEGDGRQQGDGDAPRPGGRGRRRGRSLLRGRAASSGAAPGRDPDQGSRAGRHRRAVGRRHDPGRSAAR